MVNDRVESLAYRVSGVPKVHSYDNSAFKLEVSGGMAVFHLKRDVPSLEAAERLIDEFLRSFEADEALQGSAPVTFTFEHGRMKSGTSKYVGPVFRTTIEGALAEQNTRDQSPWRRPDVAATPEAAALLARYEQYRAGHERLSTIAYMALSALQTKAGGRQRASQIYRVEKQVLDRVGELSSDHGDLSDARKIDGHSSYRSLSTLDAFWLEAATRALIKRLHLVEASKPLGHLRMADLP